MCGSPECGAGVADEERGDVWQNPADLHRACQKDTPGSGCSGEAITTDGDTVSRVAVVDFGMGNVFSVEHALRHVGLEAYLAREPADLDAADGIVIPGVGAMPDAMHALREQGLAHRLTAAGEAGVPVLGICLGFQLLMRTGTEFGPHEGLGLIPGKVVALPVVHEGLGRRLPIPNVLWSPLTMRSPKDASPHPFDGSRDGDQLYFVHSYYVEPDETGAVIAEARFGQFSFCAAARVGRIFGCQFHPERSGPVGIEILRRFASILTAPTTSAEP